MRRNLPEKKRFSCPASAFEKRLVGRRLAWLRGQRLKLLWEARRINEIESRDERLDWWLTLARVYLCEGGYRRVGWDVIPLTLYFGRIGGQLDRRFFSYKLAVDNARLILSYLPFPPLTKRERAAVKRHRKQLSNMRRKTKVA